MRATQTARTHFAPSRSLRRAPLTFSVMQNRALSCLSFTVVTLGSHLVAAQTSSTAGFPVENARPPASAAPPAPPAQPAPAPAAPAPPAAAPTPAPSSSSPPPLPAPVAPAPTSSEPAPPPASTPPAPSP